MLRHIETLCGRFKEVALPLLRLAKSGGTFTDLSNAPSSRHLASNTCTSGIGLLVQGPDQINQVHSDAEQLAQRISFFCAVLAKLPFEQLEEAQLVCNWISNNAAAGAGLALAALKKRLLASCALSRSTVQMQPPVALSLGATCAARGRVAAKIASHEGLLLADENAIERLFVERQSEKGTAFARADIAMHALEIRCWEAFLRVRSYLRESLASSGSALVSGSSAVFDAFPGVPLAALRPLWAPREGDLVTLSPGEPLRAQAQAAIEAAICAHNRLLLSLDDTVQLGPGFDGSRAPSTRHPHRQSRGRLRGRNLAPATGKCVASARKNVDRAKRRRLVHQSDDDDDNDQNCVDDYGEDEGEEGEAHVSIEGWIVNDDDDEEYIP
jgi:hypothetical protein